jgi:polygalacturonase
VADAAAEALESRLLLATYPTSAFSGPTVAPSSFNYDFFVTYSSAFKVRRSTLNNDDITVAGPNGYLQNAKLLSVDKSIDSTQLVAKYRIQAPFGMWDFPDSGRYTFTLNERSVRDVPGNPVRRKVVKALTVTIPQGVLTYPSTTLSATSIDNWSGTYVFKATYQSSYGINTSSIDSRDITVTGPNGYSQDARLVSIENTGDARVVVARYKITSPDGYWNDDQNGSYNFTVNGGQVRDTLNNPTRLRGIGSMQVGVPMFATDINTDIPDAPLSVDARTFGATPNDGSDDTDAIQAAIDSLPQGNGIPVANSPCGGIIMLPAGTYRLSRPLKLFSGVWLRGEGPTTVLNNTSTDASSSAIFFYSPFNHGYIVDPQLQNLTIQTAAAKGVKVDPTITGSLLNLRIEGLTISSGGAAMDFAGVDVFQSTINNVTIVNPGANALWLRVERSSAALNRVTGLTVTGTARAGFNSLQPLIAVGGDITLADITVKDIGARVLPLSVYQSDTGSLRNVTIETLAGNLQGGRVALLDTTFLRLDRLDGLSSTRKLALVNSRQVHIDDIGIATGSTLANAVSIDAASHLTVEHVHSASGTGSYSPSRMTVRNFSSTGLTPTDPVATTRELSPASLNFVDVRKFGAEPNDGIDDTAAIQAAIDSLPRGIIPTPTNGVGGTVMFPIGLFNTSGPIRVPSGVWLKGQGDGTVIRNTSLDFSSAAIQFVNSGGGMNVGAGLTDFGLYTAVAIGIGADSAITYGLIDPRLYNVTLSTGGVGVDLHNVKTYHARFETIRISEPGTTGFWLGDAAGYSSDNEVIGLVLSGSSRSSYVPNTPAVIVAGQTTLDSTWIELFGADYLSLKASGSLTMRGIWDEYHPPNAPDHVLMSFENCYKVDVDRLHLIGEQTKLKFRNSTGVSIGSIDIAGNTTILTRCLDLDSISRLSIETVNSIYDAGMLDDPRVKISGVYNKNAAAYADTYAATHNPNFVIDPNMTNIAQNWDIKMGDELGQVFGSWAVEQTANGPRLRITVTANPNNRQVKVEPKLSIPGSAIGKSMMARWRVDGPDPGIAWGENFEYSYAGRVTGSLTAVVSPRAAAANSEFMLLLPGTVGTYYVSNFGVVTNG